jgi:hypothetical protein
LDQPSSSKGHDIKRKVDCAINNVSRPCRNMEYRPSLGEFYVFGDRNCIFHPQEKHKTLDYDRLQGFTDEVLKMAQKADQETKPKEPKGNLSKTHKEVNYIYGGPTPMSQVGSRNSQPGRSWRCHPPPQNTTIVHGPHDL